MQRYAEKSIKTYASHLSYFLKLSSKHKPEDITQQQTAKIVSQRNTLLTKSDWMVTRHLEEKMTGKDQALSEEQFVEFLNYRQELRDITKLENFPFISLPETPKFLE